MGGIVLQTLVLIFCLASDNYHLLDSFEIILTNSIGFPFFSMLN